MEQADQTLHDFVLNLLSDSQALASFEQDPAALLDHAGLSDISAADVQEVIPLVMDYVPAHADTLDAALSQLPTDSVDTGQLGAIQQLQFVTQALGGIPAFDKASGFGTTDLRADYHVASDGHGAVLGELGLTTPLGTATGAVAGDLDHGLYAGISSHSALGVPQAGVDVPGLGNVTSLGGNLPGFSSVSDMSDSLDGHVTQLTSTLTNNVNTAANLLAGASDLAAGALANPGDLAGALANPTATVSALAGTAESYAAYGVSNLPAPANAAAEQAVHTTFTTTTGAVSEVTSHLPATPDLSGVTGHLPALDPTHALGSVQGVVSQVTGDLGTHLPTSAVTDLTSHVPSLDPTQATHAVQNVTATVQSTVSDVASHSSVSDITSTTGAGSVLGSVDHNDVTSDLGHVASDLHLPSLF
jgi:hypothetical protein